MSGKRELIGYAHWCQLQSYAKAREQDGWYYGNKASFNKRHREIMEYLDKLIAEFETSHDPR